jgi:hypothetical protein
MQISIDIKRAICNFDKENILIFFFFTLGYIIFSYINTPKNPLTEEQKNRNYRKSIKYLNRHQMQNEAFFYNLADNINIEQ